jgi:hypothetical protein
VTTVGKNRQMIIVLFEVSIKKLIQALALVNESAFYYNDYNID